MIQSSLVDFFYPLDFSRLGIAILALLFFDVLGTFIKHFLIRDGKVIFETRIFNWLIGFAGFVFVWFLVGFFVEASPIGILVSVFLLTLISLPKYVKQKEYLSLIATFKPLLIPVLLVLPLFPSAVVKSSLPPYYGDEMAYHFISPYQVLYNLKYFWTFNGGLYMNTPRLMETFYVLSFSLTHTYSVVRFLQFLILITTILSAYIIIKRVFGSLFAFLFILVFLSLPLQLSVVSTIGYVDVPAYCFMLIGFLLGLCFMFLRKNDYLILSSIFWAMSIGAKYTTITSMVIFLFIVIVYQIFNKDLKRIINKNLLIKISIGFIIFGGYWYIKNLVAYGNPIYPFFLPCWGRYAVDCSAGSSFFGQWTLQVDSKTFLPIIRDLLPGNIYIYIVLAVSPLLALLKGDKRIKTLLIIIATLFFGEMLMLKFFSGFILRYQQHLTFLLIFAVILFVKVKFNNVLLRFVKYVLVVIIIVVSFVAYSINVVKQTSSRSERDYFYKQSNIYDWVSDRYPRVFDATKWCENPPEGKVFLARYDPDMIWYESDALVRSFLLNCDWVNPDLEPEDWQNFIKISKERKLKFYTISVNRCMKQNEVRPKDELYDSNNKPSDFIKLSNMRALNNVIVCNSREVKPNLYYFDYTNLNNL